MLERFVMNSIYSMRPVNKLASVVVNQCGCATQIEFESLLSQRDQIKANATIWMRQSSESKAFKTRNKPLIKAANSELMRLNKILKPYDEHHRKNTPKDFDHAFRMQVLDIFGKDIFKQIELRAEAACNS